MDSHSCGTMFCIFCFILVTSASAHVSSSPGQNHSGQAVPKTARSQHVLPFGKPVRDAYFQFAAGTIYFNHGGFGATPSLVRKAMETYTDRMESQPTQWFANDGYHAIIQGVRSKLARFMHANASDLVFLDNASGGMNAVLRSLSWLPGDILLMIGSVYAVFPNTAAWLQRRYGICVLSVPIEYPVKGPRDYIGPVRDFLHSLAGEELARVRLVLFDHISSYPSVLLPVVDLASLIKSETNNTALVFVDGAHALGQIRINMTLLQSAGVDFYVMDGHKWLMSPHGSALLWVTPQMQGLIEPDVISSDNSLNTPFQERFDYIGTRDYGPWCTMGDTIDFRARELGGEERIVSYLHDLACWAADKLVKLWQTEAVAPAIMTAGLITVRLPIPAHLPEQVQRDCVNLVDYGLRTTYKMQVIPFQLATPNGTHWVRISAQVYLEHQDFEYLASATLKLISQCVKRVSSEVEV